MIPSDSPRQMASLRVTLRGACVKKQPHVVGAPLFCYYAKAVRMTEAGVVELADTLDLGSSGATREGSSPFARTSAIRLAGAASTAAREYYQEER